MESNPNNLNPLNTPNKHGWFANHHLLGALFIVIVFGAVVWLVYYMSYPPQLVPDQQAQIPSSNDWKTYKDKDYSFEIQYPNDGQLEEMKDSGFMTLRMQNFPKNHELPLKENEYYINVYVTSREHEKIPCTEFLIDHSQVEISGSLVKGYKGVLAEGSVGGTNRSLCVENPGKYTFVEVTLHQNNLALADQILSTLKFTEPANVVSVKLHGGLCVTGAECESEFQIYATGDIVYSVGGEHVASGNLTDAELQKLKELITSTNFVEVKKHKPTEICPIAYDGQEHIYSFSYQDKNETIPSCTYDTKKNELFDYIISLMQKYAWS